MKMVTRSFYFSTLAFVIGASLLYIGLFDGRVAVARSPISAKATMTLDLIGYNYTDHHIEDYFIDTQNGGIITISSPTSGGSGAVCCINLSPGESGAIFVLVRWQIAGCTYTETDPITGKTEELHHYLYKEEYVKATRPAGAKPNYLEAHFYPNGSVQVQITEEMSLPRLKLSEDRVKNLKFPKCSNEQRPE